MGPVPPACRGRSWHVGLLLAALVAGCSSEPSLRVPVPTGPAAGCGGLHAALPSQVDGRDAREVTPSSRRTAAWGSPAVVLRCGVARPEGLAATSELVEVDGVGWFLEETSRSYVFTATGRGTYVQVRVPSSVDRASATAPLVDLAAAVTSMPTR